MLPGVDGKGVCRALKGDAETRDVPVIMVTARGEEADIVTGLELGADDYVSKPFSPKILMARVARCCAASPPSGLVTRMPSRRDRGARHGHPPRPPSGEHRG